MGLGGRSTNPLPPKTNYFKKKLFNKGFRIQLPLPQVPLEVSRGVAASSVKSICNRQVELCN